MNTPLIFDATRELMGKLLYFIKGEEDFTRARAVMPFFYYLLFFVAFSSIEGLPVLITQGGADFEPRWPLWWSLSLDFTATVTIIMVAQLLTALIAAFQPHHRFARTLAFLGLFQLHAFSASFGGANHQLDALLWISLILVFLPNTSREISSEKRKVFSLVFWGAQAYMLLTYTMAGIGKLSYAVVQFADGAPNAFSIDAAALHVSTMLLSMNEMTPLGPTIVQFPFIGWVLFLCMLYLQTTALLIAFRPSLHRVWGVLLMLFHVMTFLTMRAVFITPSIILLVFLLSSPFTPTNSTTYGQIRALPIIGDLLALYERRRAQSSGKS